MSDPRLRSEIEDRDLDPRDAALVRRIAEAYRPAELTPWKRVEFRKHVDVRLRRSAARRVWIPGAGAAAAAALAVAAVWLRGAVPAPSTPLHRPDRDSSELVQQTFSDEDAEDAVLAFALPSDSDDAALPADYEAIGDLILEGV